MYIYSLTSNYNYKERCLSDYKIFHWQLKKKLHPDTTIDTFYEVSTNGLHTHSLVKSPHKIYIKNIHPGKGWNLDLQLTKSETAWSKYIQKNLPKQEALLERMAHEEYEFYVNPFSTPYKFHEPPILWKPKVNTLSDMRHYPSDLIKYLQYNKINLFKLKSKAILSKA